MNPFLNKLKSILTSAPVTYGAGAAGGAALGHEVIPELMGYEENPHAVALSTLLNTGTGVGLANLLRRGAALRALRQQGGLGADVLDAKADALTGDIKKLMVAGAAGEMLPMAKDMGDKMLEASKASTNAANLQAGAADNALITKQLQELWKQPAARGAVGGAAAGGLGGLASGLLRPRTDAELRDNTTRLAMALQDIGLGAAGGAGVGTLLGSMAKQSSSDVTANQLVELINQSR